MKDRVVRAVFAAAVVAGCGSAWADAPTAYVETTGSQYLITDYCAGPTTRVEADMTITTATTATRQQRFFGEDSDQSSWPFSFSVYQNGNDYLASAAQDGIGNWTSSGYGLSNLKNKRILLTMDAYNGGSANYKLSVADLENGGKVLVSKEQKTTRTKTASRTLGLAGNNRTDDPLQLAYMKIYSVKIFEKDRLVRCYVPYWNEGKSVIGLKELLSGKVIENSGSGTLQCGGELPSDPSVYLPEGWPEGYRWNSAAGRVEVRVSVAPKGAGGTVSVAGGGNEVWVEPGATVPFTVATAEGKSVVLWRGGTPTETGAGAYTVKADVPVSLSAFVGNRLCTWTGKGGDDRWTTELNWEPVHVPDDGDCILLGGGAEARLIGPTPNLAAVVLEGAGTKLTMEEPFRSEPDRLISVLWADTVDILDGAVLTHVRQGESHADWTSGGKGAWKLDGRVNVKCVNLFVDAASTISGDGLGYYCHSTEGGTGANYMCGPTAYGTTGNGAHGGYSNYVYPDRTNLSIIPCSPYDDPVHPVQAGMSGSQGDTSASPGQAGGGVIRIAATGDVQIEGTVSANSERTGGASRRAGAGGSVWISCRTIRGAGTVRANGSMNTSNANSSLCGAGGCVAIHYDAAAQAGLPVPDLKICAGVDFYSKTRGVSDVGTLYLTDSRFLRETYNTQRGIGAGRLILGDWGNWTPASLSLDNVWLRFPSEVCRNWHLTGGISVTGLSGRLDLGGETFFMVQRAVTPLVSEETINVVVDGDVTLSDSGRLSVYAAVTNGLAETWATLDVKGDLALGAKTALELFSHPTNGASCRIFCGNLSVASDASLTAAGHGFGGCINGAVKVISYGPGGVSSGCGGAHGGYSNGSFPYGDVKAPLFAGSGGGWGDNYQSGGQGGGVVYVTASGGCEINGTVSANASGQPGSSAGTGAGGSVYITAKTFTGTGSVTANGGNGQQDANTGAGGRIALVCTDAAAQKALANPAVYTFDARTYGGSSGVRVFTSDYGTLYLNDLKMASDSFAANKILHCQLYVDDWSAFEFGDIVQKDTFVRLVDCPSTVCSSIVLDNAWLEFGGDGVHRTCAYKRPYRTGRGIDLAVTGDVTLTNKARFVVRGGITNGNVGAINRDVAQTNSTFGARSAENAVLAGTVSVGGTLTVFTNAWVVPVSHPFDGGSVRFEVKNLDIREGGGFDASGNGWTTAQEGESAGYGPGAGSGNGKAAGYGGKTDDGKVYGYAKRPALPGSGAGRNNNNAAGGAGGGLVWLAVRKCATILGGLRADGENGSGTFGSGGSGGAIYLRTPELVCGPSAFFSADGGGANTGHADGKRGAGGRIAVYTQDGTVPETLTNMSVRCGQKAYTGTPMSESGTVYIGKLPGGLRVLVR